MKWNYFTQSLPGLAVCKKCQLNVKMGSKSKTTKNTSNLWTHLKIHHSSIFEEAKKKEMLKRKIHQATFKLLFL